MIESDTILTKYSKKRVKKLKQNRVKYNEINKIK